jgi:hypothetical protein
VRYLIFNYDTKEDVAVFSAAIEIVYELLLARGFTLRF